MKWIMQLVTVVVLLPGAPPPDTVVAATAPAIRVLTYNVCGADDNPDVRGRICQYQGDVATWTSAVTAQVTTVDADVLMLQELCAGQFTRLEAALAPRGYVTFFAGSYTPGGCRKWGTDTRFGNGLLIRAPSAALVEAELTVPGGLEPRGLQCARAIVGGRTTLVCNTHLAQYMGSDNGAAEVLDHVDDWANGGPVVLGGDFNAQPSYEALQVLRRGTPDTGAFAEVDGTDRGWFTADCLAVAATACASGQPTAGDGTPDQPYRKFDHILVTARDFHTVQATVIEPGVSDHRMLCGAAYAEPPTPPGPLATALPTCGRATGRPGR